jgi:hypothetical protein
MAVYCRAINRGLFARGVHVNGRNHRRPDGAAISAATRNHRRPDDAAISTTTSFRPHVLQQSDEDKKTQEEKPRRRSAHRGTFLSFFFFLKSQCQLQGKLSLSRKWISPVGDPPGRTPSFILLCIGLNYNPRLD